VFREVVRGIAERGQNQHALLVLDCVDSGLDSVEIDVLDESGIDFDWLVMVEYYGCVQVVLPFLPLVCRHVHWWFGGAEAVESAM